MSMKKKFVASGLAAGLVAGAGAGLILQSSGFAGASNTGSAQAVTVVTDDTTDDTTDGTTDGTTDATDGDRAAEREARLTEVLQPLVDAGTITADQMQSVIDTLAAAGPLGGGHGGGDHGGRGGHGRGMGLEAAATALGITADELRTQLEAGSTVAEVAAAEGVDVQTVIDAMVAEVTTHLDEEVAEGDLTQAEADTKLADATTRITDGVTNGFPQRGDRPAPAGAPADDTAPTDTTGA